jgi:hypothetical protein
MSTDVKFKVGDQVTVNNKSVFMTPRGKIGTIKAVAEGYLNVQVGARTYICYPHELDLLIESPEKAASLIRQEPFSESHSPSLPKCECGAHACGYDMHSTWCQLYKAS